MKKLWLTILLAVSVFPVLAFGQDNVARYRQNGERVLRAFTTDEAVKKSGQRQDVRTVEQYTPLPMIELTPAATGPDVVVTYFGALDSLVGLVDQIGNRQASGLGFLYKITGSPALEIVNSGTNTLLVSLAGGRLLRLDKIGFSGFFSTGSAISFAGLTDGDGLTYDFGSPDFPVLTNSNSNAIYPYAIQGSRISIGPESGLPRITLGGIISMARDSKGNVYVVELTKGGMLWKIPAVGTQTAWNRAELLARIPGLVEVAVDPVNDDLYAGAAAFQTPCPPGPPAEDCTRPSTIIVFKNVVVSGARQFNVFAMGTPLDINYGPLGGLAAYNGRVYVVSQREMIDPNFGTQLTPEILLYEDKGKGSGTFSSAFFPAELNSGNFLISGLAILH